MKRLTEVVLTALLLVLVVSALGAASKDMFLGEGPRISPLYDTTIHTGQACWIRHGWRGEQIPGRQPGFKDEYDNKKFVAAGRTTFRLFIDGVELKLAFQRIVLPGPEPGSNVYHWQYHRQFESYYFEPGTYTITGIWDITNPNANAMHDIIYAGFGGVPFTFESILTVLP
jgi:hypothetical protein